MGWVGLLGGQLPSSLGSLSHAHILPVGLLHIGLVDTHGALCRQRGGSDAEATGWMQYCAAVQCWALLPLSVAGCLLPAGWSALHAGTGMQCTGVAALAALLVSEKSSMTPDELLLPGSVGGAGHSRRCAGCQRGRSRCMLCRACGGRSRLGCQVACPHAQPTATLQRAAHALHHPPALSHSSPDAHQITGA